MKLLGYDTITIFRLWDPVKKEVRIFKDVVFNELNIDSRTKPALNTPASTISQAVGVAFITSKAVGNTTLPNGP
jgi:hypothetical protein